MPIARPAKAARTKTGPVDAIRPAAKPPDRPHHIFTRGKGYPKAIAWLGFSSFWGHVWHLAASAVATEDIDARDWMRADDAEELTARVGEALGAPGDGPTLVDQLEDDLWIDFIADSGDCSDVSGAVAQLMFADYLVPDGDDEILAPRGHILLFGGDTAYPVATELEVHNRVCVPFNRVLRERLDGNARVLLGIPGNHDWYDGLDGFARMFRARDGDVDRASVVAADKVDHNGQIGQLIDWAEAFRVGHHVAKRPALPLYGYDTVQRSSYWVLRIAPGLDIWAVDRQLRAVNYAQRKFFFEHRDANPDDGIILVISDPAYTMLEPYAIGQRIMQSLDIRFGRDAPLVLTGDTHHYCRQIFDQGMHVIAGGGGAFLHPARINRRGFEDPAAEFPGPKASFALAMQVPWQIAGGRAGFVVHVAIGLMYLPILGTLLHHQDATISSIVVGIIGTIACGMLGGWRQKNGLIIGLLAALTGTWVGALPYVAFELTQWIANHWPGGLSETAQSFLAYALSIYPGALGFGTFLMVLTVLGLEQHQAFSALANPGYKHFVRLRVRRDGSAVDGWVLGKVDTLDEKAEIVLVDHWSWNNPASVAQPEAQAAEE